MSNTYTWTVSSMQCYPEIDGQQNVVFTVGYTIEATDGTYYARIMGTQPISLSSDKTSFTPYAELTSNQVLSWVKDALGTVGIDNVQQQLDDCLANLAKPKIVTNPLPW